MHSSIQFIEYYLPEKVLTNKDLEELFPEWNATKISEKIGINQRHISSSEQTSVDLAYEAANKVFSKFEKSKIDFLLLCTQSPDYYLPASACVLQSKLGLRTNIGALDFNQGCSGYIYGLSLAKGLISSNIAQNVLLITSETYSKFIYSKDKSNRSIFGDGAAATIISGSNEQKIFNFDLGTNGDGMNNLIVPNGGLRVPFDCNPIEISDSSSTRTNNHLYMNGPEIFNFTIDNVPITVDSCLKKNNILIDEIDFVIFHQANKYMLNHLRKKMRIPENKFYINLENTGNTVSSTIPIALKDAINKNLVKKGDKILLVGFGVGYSWGSTIIQL